MIIFDVIRQDVADLNHANLIAADLPAKTKSVALTEIDKFIHELAAEFKIEAVSDLREMLERIACKMMNLCKEGKTLGTHVPLPRAEGMNQLHRIFGPGIEISIEESERCMLQRWDIRRVYLTSLLRSLSFPSRFLQSIFNDIVNNGRWTGHAFMCSQLPYDTIGHAIRCHIHRELAAVARAYGLNTIRSLEVSETDCSMSWQLVLNSIYAKVHGLSDNKFDRVAHSNEYLQRRRKTIEAIYGDWTNRFDAIIKFVGVAPGAAAHFKRLVDSGQYKRGGFMCTTLSSEAGYDRDQRVLNELRVSEICAAMVEYASRTRYDKSVFAGSAWSTLINKKVGNVSATHDLLVKVYSDWEHRWEILGVSK